MRLTDLSYAALRRILLKLEFSERTGPAAQHIFEHEPSDTIFIFRPYKTNEHIHYGDLFSAESFDQLLRKNTA